MAVEKKLSASIPKLISGKILRELKNKLVAKQICTMEPDAPIKKKGDTVYFTGLADPTEQEYNGTINYEDLEDGSIGMLIDQDRYVAFKIEDLDDFQSQLDVKGSQVDRAMYVLRNRADKFILELVKDPELQQFIPSTGGNVVTSGNVMSYIADGIEFLDENNVMGGMRWMVITPWMKQKLMLSGIAFQINNGMDGQTGGLSYANYQDTLLLVSNNVYRDGEGFDYMCAGSYNAIGFYDQMLKSRVKELENSFEMGYASRYVYGGKILKRKEVVVFKAKKGTETAI